MCAKITPLSLTKVFTAVTEYLDSKYRGHLYDVKTFSIRSACGAVDNFLSSVYSIDITTKLYKLPSSDGSGRETPTEQDYRLICKSQLTEDEGALYNLAKYYFNIIFTKEKLVYSEILEKLEQLGSWKLGPTMHHCYSQGEEYTCIVLDDLVDMGYYIPKTLDEGLTLEECKLIMKSLARLHALSLVLEGQEGCTLPEKYEICTTELLFSSGVDSACKPVTYNSFLGFLKLTEKFRPDLFPHLKRIDDDENVWNRLCELVKPGKTSFSVFCHGDPRLNNIFIQNSLRPTSSSSSSAEDGNAAGSGTYPNHNDSIISNEQKEKVISSQVGLRFIDFQLTRYASPVTDLQYALNLGTTRAFRQQNTDIALRTYYDEFQNILSTFGNVRLVQEEAVRAWTFDKLKEEYENFYMYGFLVSVILLPMILLRPGDIDKSMSQMTRAEREQFFNDGRIDLVYNIGSKNEAMRERLFELCDEMLLKNVIPTFSP